MRTTIVQSAAIFLLSLFISPVLFGKTIESSVLSEPPLATQTSVAKVQNAIHSPSIKMKTPLVLKNRKGETIDTTIIHALRSGKWSRKDSDIFMKYISRLDKHDRIEIFKQVDSKKKQINIKKRSKKSGAIDKTITQALRDGKWSRQDNAVFRKYISRLNKNDRIEMLKQLNIAVNYQQMNVGDFNDATTNPLNK